MPILGQWCPIQEGKYLYSASIFKLTDAHNFIHSTIKGYKLLQVRKYQYS